MVGVDHGSVVMMPTMMVLVGAEAKRNKGKETLNRPVPFQIIGLRTFMGPWRRTFSSRDN